VNYLGQRQYSMRIWLDPQKLTAPDMTASEVVEAIQQQNVQVAGGTSGSSRLRRGNSTSLCSTHSGG